MTHDLKKKHPNALCGQEESTEPPHKYFYNHKTKRKQCSAPPDTQVGHHLLKCLLNFSTFCCCCLVAQSCTTLLWPMDYAPGSFVHGISQARTLEWVATSFSKGSSQSRLSNPHLLLGRQILYHWATFLHFKALRTLSTFSWGLRNDGSKVFLADFPW